MLFFFPLFTILSAWLWLQVLSMFLRDAGVTLTPLQSLPYHGVWIAGAGCIVYILLWGVFSFVTWYRSAPPSRYERTYSLCVCFLGVQLSLLLRAIMIVRTEVTQNIVEKLHPSFALDEHGFFSYVLGGGGSGAVISLCVLIVLSLLQSKEPHEK